MDGKTVIGACASAAVIGGLLYFAFAPVEDAQTESRDPDRTRKAETAECAAKPGGPVKASQAGSAKVSTQRRPPMPRMKAPEDWFAKLPSAKDRAIAKRIQDAQDDDNQEAVFKAAEEALSSENAEVRQAAVTALSLQGEAAIPQLLKFVGDADKDVADSAYHAWDDAVDGVEGDFAKLGAVKEALGAVKSDEHVKLAVGKIEMFDQALAIRELAKLARDGGKAAEAAKESYESVTGEEFTSWAAAELKAISIDRDNKAADAE